MEDWMKELQAAAKRDTAPVAETDQQAVAMSYAAQLRTAAEAWDRRAAQVSDGFAQGKGAVCRDIADKLEHFGSFASQKQQDYAMKLIAWIAPKQTALPPQPVISTTPPPAPLTFPKLAAVMQKHAKFLTESVEIRRKNQDSLCWLVRGGVAVGKLLGDGTVTIFERRISGADKAVVLDTLRQIEADPEAAAREFGKLSGRCSCCGLDLTDPTSIARGIGPICFARGF